MAGVEASASASSSHCAKAEYRRFAKQEAGASRAPGAAASEKPAFLDEADDPLEDYLADSAKKARRAEDDGGAGGDDSDDDDDGLEYDASGEVVGKAAKKRIEPLPRVDHGAIAYEPFRRDFWTGNALAAGSGAAPEDSGDDYASLGVPVRAPPAAPPAPRPLASRARRPAPRARRDRTRGRAAGRGGGRAAARALGPRRRRRARPAGHAAFVWPLVVHCVDQREIIPGADGPIALVLAPTRELAEQTFREARRFAKPFGAAAVPIFGGGGKWEMAKALREGCELVVATPGRLIEMVRSGATNLRRVTALVIDEADRMFEMGFEPQASAERASAESSALGSEAPPAPPPPSLARLRSSSRRCARSSTQRAPTATQCSSRRHSRAASPRSGRRSRPGRPTASLSAPPARRVPSGSRDGRAERRA